MDRGKKQVSIDAKLHKRIKIFANVHDKTLSEVVSEAILEKLDREEKNKEKTGTGREV